MESLNVIALISGGKDSFFSLLHCQRNGHRVVALGNLFPPASSRPPPPPQPFAREHDLGDGGGVGGGEEKEKEKEKEEEGDNEDEQDLNSFMYQTVGHTVIPLYEQALGIPLYRQEIQGSAVQTGTSYSSPPPADEGDDETESLIPLLKKILQKHPHANALSTGAILSTYQRTRIESVALRLNLVPLSYLWQYPSLPPRSQVSLLEDMENVGLEARIVKVASAGLDEGFLWEDVVSRKGRTRVERAMSRFGRVGDGGVIGEGGEFESLVLDGPRGLFKGRIVVDGRERRVVREGGGSAWLSIGNADVLMKEEEESGGGEGVSGQCRIPELLDGKFEDVLRSLKGEESAAILSADERVIPQQGGSLSLGAPNAHILNWTFSCAESSTPPVTTITEEASNIITSIHKRLAETSLNSTNIISAVIILRSMADFAAVNKIYSTLFPHPNPPSRVTISCGSLLPLSSHNLSIYLTLHTPSPSDSISGLKIQQQRKALHVQSRSYWAPANIGPYSQAISFPLSTTQKGNSNDEEEDEEREEQTWIVKVAGQIPLIPASMSLPVSANPKDGFRFETVLALQHLWRIGVECDVRWWAGAVAYLPASSSSLLPAPSSPSDQLSATSREKATLIGRVWREAHVDKDEEGENGEERDLWDEKHRYSYTLQQSAEERKLPEWDLIQGERQAPPVFTVEVEELPRESGVEWHALAGVAGGVKSIKVWTYSKPQDDEGSWTIHQTLINAALTYTIISIDYAPTLTEFKKSLGQALDFLKVGEGVLSELGSMTYLDVSIEGLWEEARKWTANNVPCRGIWDGEGRRVGAVWVLEGVAGAWS